MKTRTLVSATAAFGILAVPALAADSWTGQYEGVDRLTGATISLRIEPRPEGLYDIVVNTPQHSLCAGEAELRGIGTIADDRMLRLESVVSCDGADPISSPDAAYFQDDQQQVIYAAVPTDNRRINYFRIHQPG